ncbi:hypothetical protein CAPTEDRAFT_203954 [Capitella teleta]|uniref:Uncharacterized protein n=1 Tax=Capitella teleta TaxID=283909 RepID=R7TMH5_CAPTE|nr:hypothetical protein CAPTEDRAFT_203954 [Capitella teleta]|eukprot:ELT92290.1 hypothetical protein CAPTEDRAFT_203954 [Capitella teleta]
MASGTYYRSPKCAISAKDSRRSLILKKSNLKAVLNNKRITFRVPFETPEAVCQKIRRFGLENFERRYTMDSPIVIAGILDYEIMLYIKACGNDYPSFCLIEKNVSQKHQLTEVGDALRDLVAIGCLDIITKKPQVKGCTCCPKYNIILDDVFVNGQKVLSANSLVIDPLGEKPDTAESTF